MSQDDPTRGIQISLKLDRSAFRLDVDLQLPGRGVSALFGPSGSGKTTLLRAIAGLEHAAIGQIVVGNEVWQDTKAQRFVPTHARGIGYVFQETHLFPHLSVEANLDYGERRAKARKRHLPVDRSHTLELLGIGSLLKRHPDTLSGGERQRVAIARALLSGPRLLLLDEPLASLDLERKQEVLPYLERLHETLDIPVILVSHSLDDVVRIADHLSLIRGGSIVAKGPLMQILCRTDLPELRAHDVGIVWEGRVIQTDPTYGLSEVEIPGTHLTIANARGRPGSTIRLQIHPADVSITLEAISLSSVLNQIPARIQSISGAADATQVNVLLDVGGSQLIARITRRSCEQLQLMPGTSVWAQVKAVAVEV